ncbi:MAG: (Fe-S)-binding protein [Oscillospiraceae bacterium]
MDFTLILEGIAVLGTMGAIFGALLAFAAKIFYVEVDPKQEAVRACLAGANCGGCGYPGCDGYAAAVAAGQAPVNCCVAGGQAAADQDRRDHGRLRRCGGEDGRVRAVLRCGGRRRQALQLLPAPGLPGCHAVRRQEQQGVPLRLHRSRQLRQSL